MNVNRKVEVLGQADVIEAVETLHKDFVLVSIDKANINVAIICKSFTCKWLSKKFVKFGTLAKHTLMREKKKRRSSITIVCTQIILN